MTDHPGFIAAEEDGAMSDKERALRVFEQAQERLHLAKLNLRDAEARWTALARSGRGDGPMTATDASRADDGHQRLRSLRLREASDARQREHPQQLPAGDLKPIDVIPWLPSDRTRPGAMPTRLRLAVSSAG